MAELTAQFYGWLPETTSNETDWVIWILLGTLVIIALFKK